MQVSVSLDGNDRFLLWELQFPLMGTLVSPYGNARFLGLETPVPTAGNDSFRL